ncbi:Sucrose transport protein SUC2 [Camellia lanceoleosa]|uniref:Sucrose transport protein SUC2 n=1 Tax=Camellia lanceoleosa TaxID=1840588 RepID=A0ACC0GPR1_9ERIC|nr:Sucrose transport protein SUC2 [Camellia lanceoleosa]
MENGKHPSPLQLQLQLRLQQQQLPQPPPLPPHQTPLWKVVVVASIGAGVQFGWALQFSLLTPYVQLLGIPHKWASYIWLCGPISGLVVQPLAGFYSDRCTSKFGRRRPFIAAATALVAVSVILIGFAADLGHLSGDSLDAGAAKPRAITIFVVGFWILDVGNNLLMDPCRAFLADLSDGNQRKTRKASAFFAFFTAVGQVLGYAAGSYSKLHRLLPFTSTQACNVYCANLKTCFLISITLLLILTIIALSTVSEDPISRFSEEKKDKAVPFWGELLSALKEFPRSMWFLLLAMSLNSTAWFGFKMYDTDWVGREVYGGVVGGKLYSSGVSAGSLGLMLMAAVAGVTAVAVMLVVRGVKGGNRVWGCANLLLAVCLAMTVCITKVAETTRQHTVASGGATAPAAGLKAATLSLFAVMGIAQAITYIIPISLASIFCSSFGGGQGLSLGVLNIAGVIPQLVVSLTSGPWDQLFGGGNLPAFVVGAIAAAANGVFLLTLFPSPPRTDHDPSSSSVLKITISAPSH